MANVWISFALYLVYRFVRFLFHGIQENLIWRFTGVSDIQQHFDKGDPAPNGKDCQVLSILYRKKLVDGDIGNITDFVYWHQEFVKAEDLLAEDPHWILYTMDEKYVYFLRMPKPWPFYNAREAPFLWMRQQKDATKLARMPLKAFCKFAETCLGDPKGQVVYYSKCARSGSTLLSRVMQVSEERIVCFGEPLGFTGLLICQQYGSIPDILAMDLLKGMIKYYCKTQQPGQTYLLEMQSNGARIAPLVKKAMPQVRHMFSFRRNTRRVISSVEKLLRGAVAGQITASLWNIHPELACRLTNTGPYEYDMYNRFGMKDILDIAIIWHVASWYYYYQCRHIFDLPIIYYEDLTEHKEETLRAVFKLCELPFDEFIEEALKEFKYDSQGGTLISRDKMKVVQDTSLDEKRVKKMNDMCDELGVPRIPVYEW